MRKLRLIIFGATSNTGLSLWKQVKDDFEVLPLARSSPKGFVRVLPLDIQNEPALLGQIEAFEPDAVVNTIAIGEVDTCEKDQELAREINFNWVARLGSVVMKVNPRIHLMHFSSNAVYDGLHAPYSEQSPAAPLNYYGQTKWMADQHLIDHQQAYSIVRPNTMFGIREPFQRQNPVGFIIENLRMGKEFYLVNDVYNNHLYIEDLAFFAKDLLKRKFEGVVNVAGNTRVNRYQLGCMIAQELGIDSSGIKECDSTKFTSIARRPLDTSFDIRYATSLGFEPTDLRTAIAFCCRQPESLNQSPEP